MGKYFGTDGIRGKAYDFLTYDLAFALGKSLIVLQNPQLVVGRDTRESGVMLSEGVINGAKLSGLDTLDLGVVSTPMLSAISGHLGAVGVMITASHNPFQDNGLKVFNCGEKIFIELENEIETMMDNPSLTPHAEHVGKSLPNIDPFDYYLSLYQGMLNRCDYRIALDLANGATYLSGPKVFSHIAKELGVIASEPDGKNINLNVGSTHPEMLSHYIKQNHYDFGFTFDGDGDRILMVNRDGKVFDGDLLIYIIALYLKQKSLLKDNTVVLTKMSNLGIIKALNSKDIQVVLTDIGDKYVLDCMNREHYTLGGENSGHIINSLLLNTGDGVLNAAFIVKILSEWKTTIDQLTKDVIIYPDKLVNVRNIDKSILGNVTIQNIIAKVTEELGNNGKVLVRASGTEPLIRVSVSAPTMEIVDDCIHQIVSALEKISSEKI